MHPSLAAIDLRDRRLPLWLKWNFPSSGLLCSVGWFRTDVSKLHIGPSSRVKLSKDGILSQNTIKMLAYGNFFPACALTKENITLSIKPLMAGAKPKYKIYESPRRLQYAVFTPLWRVSPLEFEHTATILNCPLFGQKRYSRAKSTVRESWISPLNRRSDIWETGITEVVTVVKHREEGGELKNDPL